jgi:hypothetical protein
LLMWACLRCWPGLRFTVLACAGLGLIGVLGVTATYQLKQTKFQQPNVVQLQEIIPPGSVVYWNAGVAKVWLLLERAQYAGPLQGAGALFSREAALEFSRRMTRLKAVEPQISGFAQARAPDGRDLTQPLNAADFCTDSVLDFVIVGGIYPQADHVVPYTGNDYGVVSVVDCSKTRGG